MVQIDGGTGVGHAGFLGLGLRHGWPHCSTGAGEKSIRDQNLRLTTSAGEAFVLKIANGLEDPALLEAQTEALRRVEQTGFAHGRRWMDDADRRDKRTHFYAFEEQGVVPDIVVLSKPIGNGHPLAALVTTPAIAASLDNGMEFFSTFGGNPVSCAVGLDVVQEESLQEHARRVGEHFLAGLRPFAERFPLVGDVRGSGLFLGVELVKDRSTLQPAAAEASYVANRMREEGILLGTDGPLHNAVKIRPPMPFGYTDAERLVETFARVLGELGG